MDTDFATQVNALDRTALTPIVERALSRQDVMILDWNAYPLTVFSAVGHIFRLAGTARCQADTLDWSVILKIIPSPASDQVKIPLMTEDPSHGSYWKREFLVYRSGLLDELPDGLTAPTCYQTTDHEDNVWLWLEEIDRTPQWTATQFGLAARKIGQMNGLYAVERPIPTWPWLATDEGAVRVIIDKAWVTDESWRQIAEAARQFAFVRLAWPDDVIADMQRLWAERDNFLSVLKQAPTTLVHGDFKCGNLFVRSRTDGENEIVAIDWARTGIAPFGQDIAGLTVHSVTDLFLPADQLDEVDSIIFGEYLRGLDDVGWLGDATMVRFVYAARIAMNYSLVHATLRHEMNLLDVAAQEEFEANAGIPAEEFVDQLGQARRFTAARAAEARNLMASLSG